MKGGAWRSAGLHEQSQGYVRERGLGGKASGDLTGLLGGSGDFVSG